MASILTSRHMFQWALSSDVWMHHHVRDPNEHSAIEEEYREECI